MRPESERIADILDRAQAIADRLARHTLATLSSDPDALKATFYDLIAMSEAMRDLVSKKDPSWGRIRDDADIVKANPDVPWSAWVGLRDMVAHQYFRAAPELVWRDHESGEFHKLIERCQAWLERDPA